MNRSGYTRQPYHRFVLHDCGQQCRLEADGWAYCRNCRAEFDGSNAWEVPTAANGWTVPG